MIEFQNVYQILRENVTQIIPNKEIKKLPPEVVGGKDLWFALYDLVFVIEKNLESKIIPWQYSIQYSQQFNYDHLDDFARRRLNQLERFLRQGDLNVNSPSYGFLPTSSKKYFKNYFIEGPGNRYDVDFLNHFFGIRHFHLDQNRHRNYLLFYVVMENEIIFLKIGDHTDLYDEKLIKTLIGDYPKIAAKQGISKYPDMPVGEEYSFSWKQIKESWNLGQNVAFWIEGKYYVSILGQTRAGMCFRYFNFTNGIIYDLENGNPVRYLERLKHLELLGVN